MSADVWSRRQICTRSVGKQGSLFRPACLGKGRIGSQMQWILLAVRSNGQRECGEQQVEKMQSESGFLGGYII